jgi:alpha-glucosidase
VTEAISDATTTDATTDATTSDAAAASVESSSHPVLESTGQDVAPWWQHGVVYQVYPRSFQDSNGDGIGDLRGVIHRLDHLECLGIDAVWLSPFYPSPMADFGYDVADYCDVDPMFGTLADFDELVADAHDRGLRIIVDLVPNHTSDRHPWFEGSRSSRDDPKRDWYVWRDGTADGEPPNNWLANFGGPAWTYDEPTRQWYLHSFLPEQPDLDWRNPEVRAAMFDVVRFWLERGVDGFRVDVAHAIGKDPELRDNPPNPAGGLSHKELGDYDTQLHVHDKNHPFVHEVYREFRSLLDSWPDGVQRVIIGEIHLYDLEHWVTYFGPGDEMHLPFNFGLLKTPWTARGVATHVEEVEAVTNAGDGRWPSYVMGNHDEHRIASRIGHGQARVAMMLLLTLRGTPTLYYGDELGHPDVDVPLELEQDPWGLRVPGLALSRDPARTPMPWEDAPNAGFTAPDVTPWLPIVDDTASYSVAAQAASPTSILRLTQHLLAARRDHVALTAGTYRTVHVDDAVYAYERVAGDERIAVVLNLTSAPQHVDALGHDGGRLEVIVSTGMDRTGALDGPFELRPDEGMVLRRRSG